MNREKELQVITLMIELYCKKKHKSKKGQLCDECQELLEYVKLRRSRCPHGDNKPFCSNCPIHCYKPSMKAKIKEVMRFSGPRMMLYHPIIAISHVVQTRKSKKASKAKQK